MGMLHNRRPTGQQKTIARAEGITRPPHAPASIGSGNDSRSSGSSQLMGNRTPTQTPCKGCLDTSTFICNMHDFMQP